MNNLKHIIKIAAWFLTGGLLLAFDLFTKHLAVSNLKNKAAYSLIDDVLQFRYLENQGAAWGIFAGRIRMFSILTIVVLVLMIFVLFRSEAMINRISSVRSVLTLQWVLVVMIAGALGNFINRVTNGYVVDFIYFKAIDFPVFNVADCYVTIATVMLLIIMIFGISEDDFNMLLKIKG